MKKAIVRIFKCPTCGQKAYAPKKKGKLTATGHIKTLYCPNCKKKRKQIQIDTK